MEFNEKLQELRKGRGLTQEELADSLYVSRTAISKWESGRGFPSIDSIKEISRFFCVSIDSLLSGDQLIQIAEKENRANISRLCDLLIGFVDLFAVILIFLPLYPKPVDGYIYSVNLLHYVDNNALIIKTYWVLFAGLILAGIVKLLMTYFKIDKGAKVITLVSIVIGIITVLFLAMAKEPYAITVAFLLLVLKACLLFRQARNN